MDDNVHQDLQKLIKKYTAALDARIDVLESQVNKLYERIVELEKRLEELELENDTSFDQIVEEATDAAHAEIEHDQEVEAAPSLLEHLIEENGDQNHANKQSFVNHTPHVTLTIDLSHKDSQH